MEAGASSRAGGSGEPSGVRGGRSGRGVRAGVRRHAGPSLRQLGRSRAVRRGADARWSGPRPVGGACARPVGAAPCGARHARPLDRARGLDGRRVRAAASLPGLSRGDGGRVSAGRRVVGARRAHGRGPARQGHARDRGRRGDRHGDLRGGGTEGDANPRGRHEPSHRPRRARAADGSGRDLRDGAPAAGRARRRGGRHRRRARGGRALARLERPRRGAHLGRRAPRRPRVRLRLRAPDHPESRRTRRRGNAVRARVLPDSAHVVLAFVDDDGQVPAAAPGARPRRGLGDVGAVPASLRVADRRVLSARGVLHRRGPVFALRGRATGLRVREGRVRGSSATRTAGRRIRRRRAARPAAVSLGSLLRAARAVRRPPRARLHGRRVVGYRTPTTARSRPRTTGSGASRASYGPAGRARSSS